LFNFFNVPFSWQFSYFSLVWDGLERVLHGNHRAFQLFNFFNVPFSWQFSYFSLVWDGLERVLHGNHRTFQLFNFFNVPFSWQFSYFSLVWDGLERDVRTCHRPCCCRDFFGIRKPPTSDHPVLFLRIRKPCLDASWSCSTAPAEICSLWSLLHVRWSKVAWPKEIFFCLGTEGAGIVGTDTEYCMDLVINLKKSSDWFLPGKFFALQTCTEVDLMSCCPALGMAKRWPRNSMCPSLVRASQHRKSKWIQNSLKLGAKMLWKPGGKKEKRRKQWIPGDSLWPFWDG